MAADLDLDAHLRQSTLLRARSTTFLNRASWTLVAILGAMASTIWLAPMARAAGRAPVARGLAYGFIAALFALIGVVVMLRRRLALSIERVAADHDVLFTQSHTLAQQYIDLERQTEELGLLSRRLAEAQRVAQIGYWEIDSETGAVYWSDEMYRLAGIEAHGGGAPMDEYLNVVHEDDRQRIQDMGIAAIRDLKEFTEQYRLRTSAGVVRTVQAKGRVVVDDHGVRKLVGTVQDVSDRVLLETQLRRSQKMEAIGQLAGGVAHDFNNVLTVIEGYTTLLLRDRAAQDEDRPYIEEIRSAARRAGALTRQLLAFSRQQVLQPRVIDLNETVIGVESMLRRLIGEDVELFVQLDPSLDPVKADPGQIEQVLMNLVVNARDAMPEGGRLVIETQNVLLDGSEAQRDQVVMPGPHVVLCVSDTGCGISSRHIEHIFEPFFTTKPNGKGTGLGLSTVQGIIEQSGGHVRVFTEPGAGTTFKVYLPRTTESAEHDQPMPARGDAHHGRERILLVEDDDAVRSMAAAVLRTAGYLVTTATDGAEALRLVERAPGAFDLVVSDTVMPIMGGRALATHVHHLCPALPMLMMSGYTRDAVVHGSDQTAREWFIEKPFTPSSLTQKVRQLLDQAAAAPDHVAERVAERLAR